jgi:hypothetical protein
MQRINIAIASPSDVQEERNAVREIFDRWNETHNEGFLHPKMWESSSVPTMGDHPQHILNPRLVDNSDLLIAIFWSKLGTPTPTADSGTVEEIREFIKKKGAGRVMLYFCTRPLPNKIDPSELARLRDFQAQMQSQGVYQEYEAVNDFERDLYFHLDQKVNELLTNQLPIPTIIESAPSKNIDSKVLPADKRLHYPIDFGMTLSDISRGFSARMDKFDAISGVSNDKFYTLGSHVYSSVAICVDQFLTYSASGMPERDRTVLDRISARLKRLASQIPDSKAPFPDYWNEGRDISNALSAHVLHLEKWKR